MDIDEIGLDPEGHLFIRPVLSRAHDFAFADPPAEGAPAMHHNATAEGAKSAPTDEELIASAMKAARKKVAESATVVVPDPKGGMRTLRKGTNGFTCMPDNPERPGRTSLIVGADAGFHGTYPKAADPDTKSPYVMWADTLYQHLMAPIR